MKVRIACAVLLTVAIATHAQSTLPARGCDSSLADRIPARPAAAIGGHRFVQGLSGLTVDEREEAIRRAVLAGNVPDSLRRLQPVELTGTTPDGRPVRLLLCVMPDYLSVGSDADFLLTPMRLNTALDIGRALGFSLPTPAMVDAIYKNSAYHLPPEPLPAGPAMRSSAYFALHDAMVAVQRREHAVVPGELVSGHKKDLVLSERLWQNAERIAIYGWQRLDGSNIQPLSTVHGWHYVDYSHGARLVSDQIRINGEPRSLANALQDAALAKTLNYGGVIQRLDELVAVLTTAHAVSFASNSHVEAGAMLLQQRNPR